MTKKRKTITVFVVILVVFVVFLTFFFLRRRKDRMTVLNPYAKDFKLETIPMVQKAIIRIDELKTLLEESPDNFETLVEMGDNYLTSENFEEAEKYYLKSLEIKRNTYVFGRLALVYRSQEEYDKAISYLEKIIAFSPNEISAHLQLANIYAHNLSNSGKAIEIYQKAILNNPDDVNLRILLGDLYRNEKRIDEAIITYRSVLSLDPDNQTAKAQLEKLQNQD